MRVYSLFHQVRIKQYKICSCFTNLLEESAAIPPKPNIWSEEPLTKVTWCHNRKRTR